MKKDKMLDRLDLWILSVLQLKEADNYMVAMSINELLMEDNDTTRISLYKHLKKLTKGGYTAVGPKDNKADSYYITEQGKEALFSIGEQEEKDVKG